MVQRGGGPSFLLEAAQMVRIVARGRPDQLQCNVASQPFVARAKDFAHRSCTDLFEDPVVPHELASHKRLNDGDKTTAMPRAHVAWHVREYGCPRQQDCVAIESSSAPTAYTISPKKKLNAKPAEGIDADSEPAEISARPFDC